MTAPHDDIVCPNCRERFEATLPVPETDRSGRVTAESTAEQVCPICRWEFVIDDTGRVADDGGLDAEPPFGVNDEGELTLDEPRAFRCPNCLAVSEFAGVGVSTCPVCRRPFPTDCADVPAHDPDLDVSDEDEDWEGCGDWGCPNCGNDGDLNGGEFVPTGGDWVRCPECWHQFLDREYAEHLREEADAGLRPHPDRVARPRTWTVASDGSGDFPDLASAVAWAASGSRLRLGPRTHNGPMPEINGKRLTVVGCGPAGSVRLLAPVRVGPAGRLRLNNVTLDGGLTVTGWRSRAALASCVIEDGRGPGVWAWDGGDVRLTGCRITGRDDAAVLVQGGGRAVLRTCQVENTRGPGVWVQPTGWARLSDTDVSDNLEGVVNDAGRAELKGCRIQRSRLTGVRVSGWGLTRLFGCEIEASLVVGVQARAKGRPRLQNCRVRGNGVDLRVDAVSTVRMEGCDVDTSDITPGGRIIVAPPRLAAGGTITQRPFHPLLTESRISTSTASQPSGGC
jgi:hypothetical protein